MTVAEQRFLELVPKTLVEIARELKEINEELKKRNEPKSKKSKNDTSGKISSNGSED